MDQGRLRFFGFVARMIVRSVALAFLAGYPIVSVSTDAGCACGSSEITIKSKQPVNREDICDAAYSVVGFFDRSGLQLTDPLVVEIVQDLPAGLGENAVGCYQEDENKVSVVVFSAFEERGTWFGLPTTRSTYRSLVAHEVAHAVAACNFAIPDPTIHAHEYIAYVAMLATMDPATRARVLALRPGLVFEDESEINELTYWFDPLRFGIEAYRHYLQRGYGDTFMLKVLSGDALTNSVFDLP